MVSNLWLILFASLGAWAQDGSSASSSDTMLLSSAALQGTALPFFADGRCATHIDCGTVGTATVTIITTTIPGVSPSGSTVTITPTQFLPGKTQTIFVVPPVTDAGSRTVTLTLRPGESFTEPAPSNPTPGSPATVIVILGGPAPTATITVTSTFGFGHGGPEIITIPGPPPLPGQDTTTITVIPPQTEGLTVTACPPEVTVTITKQPEPAPSINITKPDGRVESRPPSIFPCSENDKKPCRGTKVQGWTAFSCLFGGSRPNDGKTYPNPWRRSINFSDDVILTVSDSAYQAEHWTITLDGKKLGETSEVDFKNNKLYCSADGDSCIAKGFSHGSFLIPRGKHELEIEWTAGPLTYGNGAKWGYGYGVYRFDKLCTCASEGGHSEL